ncbi:Prenyltransferase and squalene oxidase repeat protein [Caulifigura coniformis]|uniref:Prenyltransferase and squalene oxidase repeat protein n=1 Tax=Caulifigura coniformis TaxID=2527983 RepID=A0A517SIX4_9PLAN|nr:prenyltransferase/squalene oxidase repeat-containing protein [Caulifigura coniformis]QDT56081.1 Prenyltransferase and squalene oxidase repeat protein [Caulifigura coniformis]
MSDAPLRSEPYLLRLGSRLGNGLRGLEPARREAHRQYLLSQQNDDGGFTGRIVPDEDDDPDQPPARDSDLYYTSFAVRAMGLLGTFSQDDAERVARYLQAIGRSSASVIDVVSWLYCAVMVQLQGGPDVLADAPADWPQKLAATLEEFRTRDGGYAKTREGAIGSTYHTFLVVLCLELIGQPLPEPDRIVAFLLDRRRDDGGFVEIAPMKNSGTNPTAAAVAVLTLLDAVTDDVRAGVSEFLRGVRGDDGGFQANERIPFSDSLSTFTGYLTCLDLGLTDILGPRQIRKFLAELELKYGGYRAAIWDNAADVEYTFYGLGLTALMRQGEANPPAR